MLKNIARFVKTKHKEPFHKKEMVQEQADQMVNYAYHRSIQGITFGDIWLYDKKITLAFQKMAPTKDF